MIAVCTGAIATFPVGGVAWDYGQYAVGLERLGFDVYYLEDSGVVTYDAERRTYSDDHTYGLSFLRSSLAALSPTLADRWHYCAPYGDESHGIDRSSMVDIVADADLFLNVSGLCLLRDEYLPSRRKVLIDTDPGWNQFVAYPRWDANAADGGLHSYRRHDAFFTYAVNMGEAGCHVPTLGIDWHPTRPPVLCDRWHGTGPGDAWTTVMTWDNYGKPVEHEGQVYGSKEPEFLRVERLPAEVDVPLEVAVGGIGAPIERWRDLGWRVVDSTDVSTTLDRYRTYVEASRGEFSVAKNVYVATQTGWFSCRSVCYLAAGRPAVLQDTGFSRWLATGDGLLAFSDAGEAASQIREVERRYDEHRVAARELAAEHFGSDVVLSELVDRAGVR